MPNFKCTFIMRDANSSYGWTETLVSSVVTDTAAANKLAQKYALLRDNLSGAGMATEWIRVTGYSADGQKLVGPTQLYQTGRVAKASIGVGKQTNGLSDVPWSAYLVSLIAGTRYRGRIYMSGTPDLDINDGQLGILGVDANFDKQFKLWKTEITGGNWFLRNIISDPGVQVVQPITAVGAMAPYAYTVAGLGAKPGDVVKIKGVKGVLSAGTQRVNGVYQVATYADPALTVLQSGTGTFTYQSGGTAQIRKYAFNQITDANFLRPVEHKRGRVFFQSSGRRKSRKRSLTV